MIENNQQKTFKSSSDWRVAVTSRSFSRNPLLRQKLLDRYPNATFNDEGKSLKGAELQDFLAGHDMAITALESITEDLVSQLPDLKIISKYGVGFDMVDLAALRRHGIGFGWKGGVNRRSVAELVIAFAISLLRHIPAAQAEILGGAWRQHVGRQLTEKCVGIIGFGHVGKDVARLLKPFNCDVLIHDILDMQAPCLDLGATQVGLEELLARADVVTIHLPLNETTKNMMSAERLSLMKNDALLINTARGNIVDEEALKKALMDGQLAGAGFDVFASEPPDDQELLLLPNFMVSPHIGGSAAEAIQAMGEAAIDGLEQAQEAVPENFI